ncbi:MAG: hypothetical protein HOE62_16015 [Alphaproteobacteria bacterium]|nr:hypothetical protein [Alphaproteobacteria bacterium]MBT4019459.1 hypothetical protein [Alphaproteobacteria bacterium]MBT4967281.1 hypothetical protein [Alphaproteobacteria bacterium]MBT5160476.1 hypothetical protein [Alphaproteobacteria bacterium]MBT5919477.1 hypothetical protein [Alphaproteobacteria bacterium]
MSKPITKSPWAKLAANVAIVLAVSVIASVSWRQHIMASIQAPTMEQIEMFTDMDEADYEAEDAIIEVENPPVYATH